MRLSLLTLALLAGVSLFAGCQSGDESNANLPDVTWERAVAAVTSGSTDSLICDFPVTDTQVGSLPNGLKLKELVLNQGELSEQGVQSLARLGALERLVLRECAVTDASLETIVQLPGIRSLNLPKTSLSKESIELIAGLSELEFLRLGSRGLKPSDVESLGKSTRLKHLHLIGVPLDRQTLEQLGKLPKLQTLYLDDSGLSYDDQDWLVGQFPKLHVHFDQQHHDRKSGEGS